MTKIKEQKKKGMLKRNKIISNNKLGVKKTRVANIKLFIYQTKGCWEIWQEGRLGMLKRPQNFDFESTRAAQKDIMDVKNINILVGEN